MSWTGESTIMDKAILRKRTKLEYHAPHFVNLFYKATVINKSMILIQNRCIDQWNRTENPEKTSHTWSHLIYSAIKVKMYNGEKIIPSVSGVGKTRQLH